MKYNIFFFVAFACLFLPATSHAGNDFVNLVGVPGLTGDPTAGGLNSYINALYRLSISIAALLAVIKIVIAGAKYMLSDIVTHKEDAKKDIQGALIGLLIVIGAIIILNTINTDLTNLDLTIDTTTVNQVPTIQELIAQQQRSQAERAAAMNSRVVTGQCETFWGANGFDMLPGETEEQACERVCESPPSNGGLGGRFIYNYVSSDQCEYIEAAAAECNPNNRTCCEGIRNQTWYAQNNVCSTAENPVTITRCETVQSTTLLGIVLTDSCTNVQEACRASGNTVVNYAPPTGTLQGSVACTDTANTPPTPEGAVVPNGA